MIWSPVVANGEAKAGVPTIPRREMPRLGGEWDAR